MACAAALPALGASVEAEVAAPDCPLAVAEIVNLERAFGRTRRYLREEGEDPAALSVVMGLRAWF